jgi:predicted enzyme related to lactoylglutathione lyase
MLNFNSIMIGSHQAKVLVEFYTKVFDKKPDMGEGDWGGWQIGKCFFNVGEHSEVKGTAKEPQRIILNLETEEIDEEFERIKKVESITVVKELYEMDEMPGMKIATFADPDGNYFQLMTPWKG